MKRFNLTIFFLLYLSTLISQAQNVLFFNSKQGLSNTCIHSLYEDSRHNIWITTQNGLNRYDGAKMNSYQHIDGDENSLLFNDATATYEFDRDNIIIGTGIGLQIFHYPTNKFTYIPFMRTEKDTLHVRIEGIYCIDDVKNGKRFLLTFSGYGCGEIKQDKNGKFTLNYIDEFITEENHASPIMFFQDPRKNVWLINSNRHVCKRTGTKFKTYNVADALRMVASSSGKLYVITSNSGLYVYNSKADSFRQIATREELGGVVYGFNSWTNNRLLISTDGGGLRIFDETTGKISQSNIKINDFDLATSNVKDAIRDKNGNVWVGIYWKGVMMKPSTPSAFDFEYVGRHSIGKNTIGTNSITSMALAHDDNHLWVATDNDGIYYMNADGSASHHYGKASNPNAPANFTAIHTAPASTLYLGTFFEGLWKMNGGQFNMLTKDINQIFDIQSADNDNLWIATIGNGFFYYTPSTGKYIRYSTGLTENSSNVNLSINPYVYCILPHRNQIIVGTADGLCFFTHDGNGTVNKKSETVLRAMATKHIAISPDGKYIWAGTNTGLYRITNDKQHKVEHMGVFGNTSIKSCESLIIDDQYIWAGTDDGLYRLDTEKNELVRFVSEDGIQDNEFTRGAVLAYKNKLYFGGISGLTYFNPKSVIKSNLSEQKPKLRLIDLIVNGRVIHSGDMSGAYNILDAVFDDCGEFELNHRDNHFAVELMLEGFTNMHINYEYSYDGEHWINQSGSDNRIIFDNIKPGSYTLYIKGTAFGVESEVRKLHFVVHSAWYASSLAKFIYFLLFLVICYLAYIYAKRQITARKLIAQTRQLEEINEARMQFFMNISHEIRTPMTLILAPLERLINSDKDPEHQRNYGIMKQNSNRILRLVNQMMDVRKIEQGKFLLHYGKVELVSFIQNIYEVFYTNAQSRHIEYLFEHDIDTLNVFIDSDNTDKIVMNLLSNAFKFTADGGKITIKLTTTDNEQGEKQFKLEVCDNGAGIKDEDKPKVFDRFYSGKHKNGYIGTGIGLNLTSMLVNLHKGTITVSDNPEEHGTLFVVTMPVGDETNLSTPILGTANNTEPSTENKQTENTPETTTTTHQNDDVKKEYNVVVVEDDEAIRQYLRSEFEGELSIREFSHGQEAWDYILANPKNVDIVISDVMMPVMDGLTLCQKVKSNFLTNHIPIILMTALGSDSDRIVGLTNGADAYVAKPFNIDILRTTAINLMNTRRLLQGRFKSEQLQEENIDKFEIESPDENLMARVMKVINENMDNEELSVEMIADKVGISRVHFYRKMKELTGQAPREFLKYIRLKEAARLLSSKKMDITGVSIACGFKSPSSFSTYFKSLYGLSPSEWMKKMTSEGSLDLEPKFAPKEKKKKKDDSDEENIKP